MWSPNCCKKKLLHGQSGMGSRSRLARAAVARLAELEKEQDAQPLPVPRPAEEGTSARARAPEDSAHAASTQRTVRPLFSWRPTAFGCSEQPVSPGGLRAPQRVRTAPGTSSSSGYPNTSSSGYPSSSSSSMPCRASTVPCSHTSQLHDNGSGSDDSDSEGAWSGAGSANCDGMQSDDEQQPAECTASDDDILYGAAGRSTSKRMRVDGEMRTAAHTKRPTHAAYRKAKLEDKISRGMINSNHKCKHMWCDAGEDVQCHHQLWARGVPAAISALQEQRRTFLEQGTKARGKIVYNALTFQDATQLHAGAASWQPPVRKVVYRVGFRPEAMRLVCREIFLAHYPVSLSTLKRIVARSRIGADLYVKLIPLLEQHRISNKTLHVLSWWLEYAKQVLCLLARARARTRACPPPPPPTCMRAV